jgi:hypothetical protein
MNPHPSDTHASSSVQAADRPEDEDGQDTTLALGDLPPTASVRRQQPSAHSLGRQQSSIRLRRFRALPPQRPIPLSVYETSRPGGDHVEITTYHRGASAAPQDHFGETAPPTSSGLMITKPLPLAPGATKDLPPPPELPAGSSDKDARMANSRGARRPVGSKGRRHVGTLLGRRRQPHRGHSQRDSRDDCYDARVVDVLDVLGASNHLFQRSLILSGTVS